MREPEGREYRLVGTYQEVQVPRRLVFTWVWESDPSPIETRVTVQFRDLGSEGTEVVVLHEFFPTDAMLALARENQRKAGLTNVEFLKGEIERIPLPDNSVDVIISNCVINLSADKDKVLREAFRVLKPGGRFAVSDVVTRGEMPGEIREKILLWVGCIAGALEENDYRSRLKSAGFENIDVEPTRIYHAEDARTFLSGQGMDIDAIAPQVDGKFMSAFVRATKPKGCCGPACCS
jgi:SAM-dependent methyltransferase